MKAAGSRERDRAGLSWWEIAAHLGQLIGAVVLAVREFVVDPSSPVWTMALIAPSALLVFAFLVALVAARARRAAISGEPLFGQTCLLLGWCGIQWGEFFRTDSAAQHAVLTAALLVLAVGCGAVVRSTVLALRRERWSGTGGGG